MPARFELVFQSWDTANKTSELSDYSVCTTWGVYKKYLYFLHVLRKRLDYPDLKREVKQQAELHQARNILIEDKASGTQLIQELKAEGLHSITHYDPRSLDKVMRMHSVSSTIENGFVHIPVQASWRSAYLDEMAAFPNGKYDDQVDSTSQALDWWRTGAGTVRLTYWEYLLEEGAKKNNSPESLRREELEAQRAMVRQARCLNDRGW